MATFTRPSDYQKLRDPFAEMDPLQAAFYEEREMAEQAAAMQDLDRRRQKRRRETAPPVFAQPRVPPIIEGPGYEGSTVAEKIGGGVGEVVRSLTDAGSYVAGLPVRGGAMMGQAVGEQVSSFARGARGGFTGQSAEEMMAADAAAVKNKANGPGGRGSTAKLADEIRKSRKNLGDTVSGSDMLAQGVDAAKTNVGGRKVSEEYADLIRRTQAGEAPEFFYRRGPADAQGQQPVETNLDPSVFALSEKPTYVPPRLTLDDLKTIAESQQIVTADDGTVARVGPTGAPEVLFEGLPKPDKGSLVLAALEAGLSPDLLEGYLALLAPEEAAQ